MPLRFSLRGAPLHDRLAPRTGMDFDHRRSELGRHLDLRRGGSDKQGNPDAGMLELMHHGLDYGTAETIAALPQVVELNIGHFLVGESVFEGLAETVKFMRAAMDRGRKKASRS